MSTLIKQVYQLLSIKSLRTTPYHPQTDGLTERFNQTLKQMLRSSKALHVNLLKEWVSRSQTKMALEVRKVEEEDEDEEQYLPRLTPLDVELQHLPEDRQHHVRDLCTP